MDSLAKKKLTQKLALAGILVVALALVVYSVFRGDPEEEKMKEVKGSLMEVFEEDDEAFIEGRQRTPEEKKQRRENLKQIRKVVKKLSPETRKKLTKQIIKARVTRICERTKGMNEDEKYEYVEKIREKIRDKFDNMSDNEREKIKNKMVSKKGKGDVSQALDTYYNEVSAKEKELLDPVITEMLNGLNSL